MRPAPAGAARAWLEVAVAAAVLVAVGAWNTGPTVFADTGSYYAQGEYLAGRLGLAPELSVWRSRDSASLVPEAEGFGKGYGVTIAAARSAWYGLVLFLTHRVGGLWLLSALQALAAAWLVRVAVRAALPERSAVAYPAAIAALALGSSLPFFTNFAMPDVFAGFGVLAAVLLLVYPQRLALWEKAAVWTVLALAAAFHTSNLVVLAGLVAVAAGLLALMRTPRPSLLLRTGAAAAALAVAVIANAGYAAAYRADAGVAQRSPPFLMARVIADGPGRDYLRAVCPAGPSPTLCRYAHLPLEGEEDFLWSTDPDIGVFGVMKAPERARLKQEEAGFVLAVVRHDPIGVLAASGRNALAQLSLFFVDDPLRNPYQYLGHAPEGYGPGALAPQASVCAGDPDRCDAKIPLLWLTVVHAAVLVMSIAVIAFAFGRLEIRRVVLQPGAAPESGRLLAAATALVLLALLGNAVACGVLAGPFPRYEARMVWLLPLMATLMGFAVAGRARADAPRLSFAPA